MLFRRTTSAMRYAVCNELFGGLRWAEACRETARLGYQGVEMAPFTLAEDVTSLAQHDRSEIAAAAQRAGVQITGLHWLLVSPAGLSLTSDNETARRSSGFLAGLVDFCADVGGRLMVLGSPSQRRVPPGATVEEAEERLLQSLSPALRRAEQRHVSLCLEPLPAPEADLVLTLSDAARMIQRSDSPALKTVLDVKSASTELQTIPDLIRQYCHLFAHVHANDANRGAPGTGAVDFVPIFRSLLACSYQGWISLEIFDRPADPSETAAAALSYMRRCEESAQHA